MRKVRWSIVLLLLAAAVRAEGRLVGSDLLGPSLVPALEDYARRSDVRVATAFEGSHPGWQQLQFGRADLAILTFPPGQELPAGPYVCLPLAYHVTVVLVPESLPLGQLSYARLTGVFGAAGGKNFARWGELGLSGAWAARPIAPQALNTAGASLATDIFRHFVLHDGLLRSTIAGPETLEGLLHGLAQAEAGGIALAAQLPPAGSGLKALAVAREDNEVAFTPTPENVHRGDYGLCWPVYLVFRRADAPRLFPLLRHMFGEEVAQLCGAAGLMPLPAAVRAQQIFDLEQL